MASGSEYRLHITREDEVFVSTREHDPLWKLRPERPARWWRRAPSDDLLLVDANGTAACAVRRLRRFPRPRYALLAGEEVVGTIDCLSVWRTHYRLAFTNGRPCEFRTPLFSTRFTAASGDAAVAHVRMLRENLWAVLFEPGEDRPELFAALARLLYARWHSE